MLFHIFSSRFFFSQDLTKKRQCQRQWQRQWHILSEILRIFEILIMILTIENQNSWQSLRCLLYIWSGAFVPGQGIICVCCQQILKTQSLKICRRLTGHCATAMHKSNLESMKNQARHRNGWSWSHSSGSVWCSSLSFCWSGHIFSSLCCLDNLFSTKFIESLKKSQQKVINDANILAAKHMATNWSYRWAWVLSPSIDDCATRAMILSLYITLANFKGSPA